MPYDKDLNPVLEQASNEELEYLVEIITKTFSNSLEKTESYIQNYPDHQKYTKLLAAEIRAFGGNSIMNYFRGGRGPEYKEIVCDVARKLKVPFNKHSDIERIENSIFETVLSKALEKMSDEEKRNLLKEIDDKANFSLSGAALTAAFVAIFKAGGVGSIKLLLVTVNAISKLVLGRGVILWGVSYKMASLLAGPLVTALTAGWLVVDIAGPATRVTIPAVIYVAMLRKKINLNTEIC